MARQVDTDGHGFVSTQRRQHAETQSYTANHTLVAPLLAKAEITRNEIAAKERKGLTRIPRTDANVAEGLAPTGKRK
jgi:hypothetical protein